MGASPAIKNNFTPSKHQVNLGSDHAAAYYFGEHTPAKQQRKNTPAKKKSPAESVNDMADTSMLSEASTSSSSSDGSDLLNKSVLSDTTELTASNFVLQASSRQRLLELSQRKHNAPSTTSMGEPEKPHVAPSTLRNEQENNTMVEVVEQSVAENNGENSRESTRNASTAGNTPAKSPSLRSRLGESPASLKQLSASLRKETQQHRSAVSFMLPLNEAKNNSGEDTTVEIETADDKPLGDVLNPSTEQQEQGAETASSQVGHLLVSIVYHCKHRCGWHSKGHLD